VELCIINLSFIVGVLWTVVYAVK